MASKNFGISSRRSRPAAAPRNNLQIIVSASLNGGGLTFPRAICCCNSWFVRKCTSKRSQLILTAIRTSFLMETASNFFGYSISKGEMKMAIEAVLRIMFVRSFVDCNNCVMHSINWTGICSCLARLVCSFRQMWIMKRVSAYAFNVNNNPSSSDGKSTKPYIRMWVFGYAKERFPY